MSDSPSVREVIDKMYATGLKSLTEKEIAILRSASELLNNLLDEVGFPRLGEKTDENPSEGLP